MYVNYTCIYLDLRSIWTLRGFIQQLFYELAAAPARGLLVHFYLLLIEILKYLQTRNKYKSRHMTYQYWWSTLDPIDTM